MFDGCDSDEDEEDAFEKDIAIDQLRIHDYSRFYSQYGNRVKPGTSPAFNLTVRDLPVPREDPDGFIYQRSKRAADDDVEYSGGVCIYVCMRLCAIVTALCLIQTHDCMYVRVLVWVFHSVLDCSFVHCLRLLQHYIINTLILILYP